MDGIDLEIGPLFDSRQYTGAVRPGQQSSRVYKRAKRWRCVSSIEAIESSTERLEDRLVKLEDMDARAYSGYASFALWRNIVPGSARW